MIKISNKTKLLCPEIDDIFIDIESILPKLRGFLKSEIKMKNEDSRLLWKYEIFTQFALYRCIDLAESVISCWEQKRIAPSYIILRSLYENTALLLHTMMELINSLEIENYDKIIKLIDTVNFGTRLKRVLTFPATNILTIIDKLDKHIEQFRYNYDLLCEFTHPNCLALIGTYGDLTDSNTCKLSSQFMYNGGTATIIFSTLFVAISLTYKAVQKFHKNKGDIVKIEIKNRNVNL
jgi:hypothetical protein